MTVSRPRACASRTTPGEIVAKPFVIDELTDRAKSGGPQRPCGVLRRHRGKPRELHLLEAPVANLLQRAREILLQFVPDAVELEAQPPAGRVGSEAPARFALMWRAAPRHRRPQTEMSDG